MGALHRFEQRLEHVVSGAFARAFRSAVQPVEIAARLQREVDNSAEILSRNRMLVPNHFVVGLSPSDFDRLSAYDQTLRSELARMVNDYVTEQSYILAGPLSIDLERSEGLITGRFDVRSRAVASVDSAGDPPSATQERQAPVVLEVNGVRHPVMPPGVVLGRGSEADLRINDPGVSRRHVEVRVVVRDSRVSVSAVDLGSTNGTVVDGRQVQQALVRDGSQILIGRTTVTVLNPHAQPVGGPAAQPAPGQGAR